MGESAMMRKPEHRSAKLAKNVKVGGLSGQGQRRGGERGPAIESGAAEVGAEQKVSDRFQAKSEVRMQKYIGSDGTGS